MQSKWQKRRKIGIGVLAGTALLWVCSLPAIAAKGDSSPCGALQAGLSISCPACAGCELVREIDDPHTGQHWLLMRDSTHPGGPGALLLEESLPNRSGIEAAKIEVHPVIHAGDRVTIEQSNARFNLRLGGIALSPAAAGAPLKVRLEISGRAVQATALGAGRALLVPDKEFQP
jgi:hypothetical protein